MCLILPQPQSVRKHISEILAQAEDVRTIEEIASSLRVQRVVIRNYLHFAVDFFTAGETTATRLLKEAEK